MIKLKYQKKEKKLVTIVNGLLLKKTLKKSYNPFACKNSTFLKLLNSQLKNVVSYTNNKAKF